ncbi:MAG: SDR family NAD(P)-dependent oxidoreductase [Deltaproteobacteria bacterium]|nr:SDR family NAD(P)-dependent oxidoreductase [Deltaproteobacteria bacterium]
MKNFYHNKTILITGASSGIGKDLALFYSAFNTKLILLARREDLLKQIQDECQKNGSEVLIFAADVSDRKKMEAIASDVLNQWGFVDIVIANAGVGGLNPADHFSLDLNQKFVAINILGLAYTLVPFIDSMKQNKKGILVGISSLAAFRGLPKAASYSSSKAAQGVFLESLRVDLKKYGISVCSIHPGFIETPMTDHDEFKMPFMVPVRKSSILIAKAIKRKKAVYLYPWPMRILTYINKKLPVCVYDYLVPRLSGQKQNTDSRTF